MNIGIATIYKCYNFGSFFQAFALQEYLNQQGHTAFFIDTDCPYNRQRRRQRLFSRSFTIKKNLFSLKSFLAYRKDWLRLNPISPDQKADCVIAGSDEIWNIRNKTFAADTRYYGDTFPIPCISYAPSVARASIQDFNHTPELLDFIRSMKQLSARDQATENFLRQLDPTREITQVLDPSFLIDWQKYERPVKSPGKFIMVYTYDNDWGFPDNLIKQTKAFAQKTGLPLYSFGFLHSWCDRSIACSPLEFLGYLRHAEYVITDTFHGTVMSLQYQKRLACMARQKEKISSMALWLGLDMNQWTLEKIEEDKPYMELAAAIDKMRLDSMEYLSKALHKAVDSK